MKMLEKIAIGAVFILITVVGGLMYGQAVLDEKVASCGANVQCVEFAQKTAATGIYPFAFATAGMVACLAVLAYVGWRVAVHIMQHPPTEGNDQDNGGH